jgi:hypothetical protein
MPVPPVRAAASERRDAFRIDTERLRQEHPIVDVVRRYGVELRRSGSSFTGRCPFHADQGRPNFVVFPRSERWWCFRCAAGSGDECGANGNEQEPTGGEDRHAGETAWESGAAAGATTLRRSRQTR